MTYNMPTSARKHCESTEPETRQMAKTFFFLSSSSSSPSDGLVENCVTLSQWFSHKAAALYTEQCTSPSLFHNFEISRSGLNWSLKTYGFISDAILKKLVRMRTNHLAMKQLLFKIADLEIESYCIHLPMKPMRTDLLLCDSGKLQLKHAPAAKK